MSKALDKPGFEITLKIQMDDDSYHTITFGHSTDEVNATELGHVIAACIESSGFSHLRVLAQAIQTSCEFYLAETVLSDSEKALADAVQGYLEKK